MRINEDTWSTWTSEQFQKYFGTKTKERRLLKGLTQKELGNLVGLSKQSINDIEKGRRSTGVTKAIKIAEVLDTGFAYLVGRDDNPNDYNAF